jgi:hypothetical protein
MEPSDLGPDDARKLIEDIEHAIHERARQIDDDKIDFSDYSTDTVPTMERVKQYYGNDTYQLISGIRAALREWDESGDDVQELKDKYSGKFVDGVEIGERLVVYEGRDFTFVQEEDNNSDESKFTFV